MSVIFLCVSTSLFVVCFAVLFRSFTLKTVRVTHFMFTMCIMIKRSCLTIQWFGLLELNIIVNDYIWLVLCVCVSCLVCDSTEIKIYKCMYFVYGQTLVYTDKTVQKLLRAHFNCFGYKSCVTLIRHQIRKTQKCDANRKEVAVCLLIHWVCSFVWLVDCPHQMILECQVNSLNFIMDYICRNDIYLFGHWLRTSH